MRELTESNREKEGRTNPKAFADNEMILGGRTILHIIDQMNKKDPSMKSKPGHPSLPTRDRATSKKTLGTKHSKQEDFLMWTNEAHARRLAEQVEEE